MTLTEIVNQIRLNLSIYTSILPSIYFDGIIVNGGEAIVFFNSPKRNPLIAGDPIIFTGVNYIVQLLPNFYSPSENVYVFETLTDHDLTENWHETVTFALFQEFESEWNNAFKLLTVPNRRTFSIESNLPPPTIMGALVENRIDGINGYYQVIEPANNFFKFATSAIDGGYYGGTLLSGVRVAAAANIDRVLEQYTKQNTDDLWMIVLPVDVDVAKSIYADSDAVATITASDDFRLRLLDGFTLAIIKSTVNESAAVEAVDLCRHDLLKPILKTLCGVRFESGLTTSGDFRSSLIGHGVMRYTEAYIVYRYDFEVVMDTVVEDTVIEGDVTAFRDIELNQSVRIWLPD